MLVRLTRRVVMIVAILSVATVHVPSVASADVAPPQPGPVELTLFWGEGCPHCAAEREFLEDLRAELPDLVVREYEVWHDPANLRRFVAMAAAAGVDARAVPTTFVGDRVWVGFSPSTGEEIRAVVAALLAGDEPEPAASRVVDVPLLGEVDVGGRSLLFSTLVIGFVDGINPCSLWMLTILLALVLHSGSRGRVAAVGSVFLLVTSAMYGLYIVGAYSTLSYATYVPWIQRGVAVVALVLGALQLKDAAGISRGPSLSVAQRTRPATFGRMRSLATADRPLAGLLGATATLAAGVSLLETPCTLGLPILWTDLLAESDVPPAGALVLFTIYLAAFLIDEVIVFVSAVATMRALKVQERHGRALKLVSGVMMLTLAAVMLLRPETMETIGGVLVVFGVAAAVSAVGIGVLHAFGGAHAGSPGSAPSARRTRHDRDHAHRT